MTRPRRVTSLVSIALKINELSEPTPSSGWRCQLPGRDLGDSRARLHPVVSAPPVPPADGGARRSLRRRSVVRRSGWSRRSGRVRRSDATAPSCPSPRRSAPLRRSLPDRRSIRIPDGNQNLRRAAQRRSSFGGFVIQDPLVARNTAPSPRPVRIGGRLPRRPVDPFRHVAKIERQSPVPHNARPASQGRSTTRPIGTPAASASIPS
jgi:hypothetical protein